MVTCPKCGKPVSGRARICGYCGESLVGDYFSGGSVGTPINISGQEPLGAGAVSSVTLGLFGSLALLGAAAMYLVSAGDQLTQMGVGWWLTVIPLAVLASVDLIRLLLRAALRRRGSLLGEGFWLFASVTGLSLVAQAYMDQGAVLFYGVAAIPYMLVVGCSLLAVSAATGLFSC